MNTSERLIESTRELLWERGYVGTSPKAILERSGAGQGSMYHHFKGKPDLALAAIRRTATELRATAEALLGGPGTPYERIEAYLLRERDVLRGCPVGRLTMDPEVIASDELRAPVDETIAAIRDRIAELVEEGKRQGQFAPELDGTEIGAAVLATVQGGYVLARASGSPAAFDAGVRGLLALLAPPDPRSPRSPRNPRNPLNPRNPPTRPTGETSHVYITRRRPDTRQGPADTFTGAVWLDEIAAPAAPSRLRMFNVHFAPGAHTAWHTHPHGQVLHVLEGEGLVGRAGGEVEEIRAGDTVWIEPGERHWHGAGPRTFMTHLAVVEAAEDGTTAEWHAHVSDYPA